MKPRVPEARVVRDGLRVLASPPRKVPASLWLRIMLGGWGNGTFYFVFAFLTWIVTAMHLVTGGTHEADEPPVTLIMGAFIVLALPVIIGFAIYNTRRLRLLRKGDTVQGTLVKKYEVEGSESSSWHYVFAYEVNGQRYEVDVRMQNREPRLEDDPTELMVYLPSRPDRASPVDYLPGYPTIDENGQLVARDPRIWPALLLPGITLAGILIAFLA